MHSPRPSIQRARVSANYSLTNGKSPIRYRGVNRAGIASSLVMALATAVTSVATEPEQVVITAGRSNGIGLATVLIPAGDFLMGSPRGERVLPGTTDDITLTQAHGGASVDETQHQVAITRPFEIGVLEVTAGQWAEIMGSRGRESNNDRFPAAYVAWTDAIRFCNRLSEREGLQLAYRITADTIAWDRNANGFRLPTESEWEYAARAGTTGPFWFGGEQDAPYPLDKNLQAAGTWTSNPWGLYDVHGNVWEWVWDVFGPYPLGNAVDPAGGAEGIMRVMRGGGACGYVSGFCRSAWRLPQLLGGPQDVDLGTAGGVGFRVARNPAPGHFAAADRWVSARVSVTKGRENDAVDAIARSALENLAEIRMVSVRAERFVMGRPLMRSTDPPNPMFQEHLVTLTGDFLISATEINQAQWGLVMKRNPSQFQGDALPVETVTWFDAVQFCNLLSKRDGLAPCYEIDGSVVTWNPDASGYRLPTEAEWEYAARAGTTTPYHQGATLSADQANFNGLYPDDHASPGINRGRTTPVASFEPNAWGLYDVHGNVFEWCWDWLGPYGPAASVDPRGPEQGVDRIRRGGSWFRGARLCRSYNRHWPHPGTSDKIVGFRVARNG